MKNFLRTLWTRLVAVLFRVTDVTIEKAVNELSRIDAKLEAVIGANRKTLEVEEELRRESWRRAYEAGVRVERARRVQNKVRALID